MKNLLQRAAESLSVAEAMCLLCANALPPREQHHAAMLRKVAARISEQRRAISAARFAE